MIASFNVLCTGLNLLLSFVTVVFKTLLLFPFASIFFKRFLDFSLLGQLEYKWRTIGSRPTFFCFFKFRPTPSPDKNEHLKPHTHTRTHTSIYIHNHTHTPSTCVANREHLRCRGKCTGNKYSHSEKPELVQVEYA